VKGAVTTWGVVVAVNVLLGATVIDSPLRFVAYVTAVTVGFAILLRYADTPRADHTRVRGDRFDVFGDDEW
jgi:hypothetical protein